MWIFDDKLLPRTQRTKHIFQVMDCLEIGQVGSVEFGWILSRDQQFRESEMFAQVHQKAIEQFGFKTENTIQASHDDCTYDYIKYCNDSTCGGAQ